MLCLDQDLFTECLEFIDKIKQVRYIKTLTRHLNKFNSLQYKHYEDVCSNHNSYTQYVIPLTDNDINRDINHWGDDNNNNNEQMGWQYVQFPLMEAQSSLLARGPKSAVVPRHPPKGEYITSVEEVCLHLPPPRVASEIRPNTSKLLDKTIPRPNITLQEARAIKELKNDQSRIILTADKGVTMVVMDRQDYITKTKGLLDDKGTYRPLLKDPTPKLKSAYKHSQKVQRPRTK